MGATASSWHHAAPRNLSPLPRAAMSAAVESKLGMSLDSLIADARKGKVSALVGHGLVACAGAAAQANTATAACATCHCVALPLLAHAWKRLGRWPAAAMGGGQAQQSQAACMGA
jgi:hypothetical protein